MHVKCIPIEGHRITDCPKPKKTKVNCAENNTDNWKALPIKKAIERAHPKQVTAVQRIQPKPVQ